MLPLTKIVSASRCTNRLGASLVRMCESSTACKEEVEKFNKSYKDWWEPTSKANVAMLHHVHPTRMQFINYNIDKYCISSKYKGGRDLSGLSVLDIGCGGGILSETLARQGATVDGIDANEECIRVAEKHFGLQKDIKGSANYSVNTIDQLAKTGKKYDMVFALEVIEHVQNKPLFVDTMAEVVKTGGLVFISTLARNPYSWFANKFVAEDLLHILPKNTHDYHKFVSLYSLRNKMERGNIRLLESNGILTNPFTFKSCLVPLCWGNYIVCGTKL